MLNEFTSIPDGLLTAKAHALYDLLGGPTLIHLEGINSTPLFISTLLHGDETTGFYALQSLLKQYSEKDLPRSLSIFIGNVEAAAQDQRHLDTQADYNRIWPGTNHDDTPESDMMKHVVNIMRKRKPFASIDVHNNTGFNPHYACVNILNSHGLQLASLFSDTTVYFTNPKGVQSSAFSDFCPAIVLECGQSGDLDGISHCHNYLDQVIQLETIPQGNPECINLYHTVARVIIPARYSYGSEPDNDIVLFKTLENKNFQQLEIGTVFFEKHLDEAHMSVINESSEDVTDEFFEVSGQNISLKKAITLSMYTTNTRAISLDCLCYFMEPIHIS